MVKMIGAMEVPAAIGLVVLPAALGVAPILAPLAAVGLVLLMLGAAVTHLRRNELQMLAANLVLIVLALVVVRGHHTAQPLAA
jgi:DoxX-like family